MAKGTVYGPERAILRDPRSGLRIIRLTHYSTISMNLYFEMCSFTEDDQYVMLLSQRGAARDAPWDVFRARTEGLELLQLTECDDIAGVVVSPATHAVLYQTGEQVRKVDIRSLEDARVAATPGITPANPGSLASVDAQGTAYFSAGMTASGTGVLFKVDLSTGHVAVLFKGGRQNHVHVDPDGLTVYFGDHHKGGATAYLIDADGSNLRPFPFTQFAHLTWLGETGRMQGCLLPPDNAIATYAEGATAPDVLTGGRYYWHSSASRDAQWIVADTNWPPEGIYLLHTPTRTVTYVCDPLSSCSHPQWTHPHPAISPGMKYILFNSDMTGIGQVYLAELTEDFLTQAANGYLCTPNLAF